MEHLNTQIDINLQLLADAKLNVQPSHLLVDINKRPLTQKIKGDEFARQMEQRGLISMNGSLCTITEFGYQITKNGGWLNHLKRENQKLKNDEQENIRITTLSNKKLEYEVKLAKWQVKSFWPIFVIALLSSFYSGYEIISDLKKTESEKSVTLKELNSRLKIFHDSISKDQSKHKSIEKNKR